MFKLIQFLNFDLYPKFILHFTASDVSPTLNYVDLTVITNTECAETYGDTITPTKICTATPLGQSTCNVSFSFRYIL